MWKNYNTDVLIFFRWCTFCLLCLNLYYRSLRCLTVTMSPNLLTIFLWFLLERRTTTSYISTFTFPKIISVSGRFSTYMFKIYFIATNSCVYVLCCCVVLPSNRIKQYSSKDIVHSKNISTLVHVLYTFCSGIPMEAVIFITFFWIQ